jgi:profilin
MSWQTYVDSNLVGTKKIAQAVIVGHDGNQWAASKGFAVCANHTCCVPAVA